MLKLRPYQEDFINGIKQAMCPREYMDEDGKKRKTDGYRRVCGYLPQGAGKSIVIASIAAGAASKGTKTLILTHREEIFGQNIDKMELIGLNPTTVNAQTKKLRLVRESNLVIAMAQTIASRCRGKKGVIDEYAESWIEWVRSFEMIVVDEAHRGEMDSVMKLIDKNTYTIGLTASICRMGNAIGQLGAFYDCIVKGITTKELIELGYLVKSRNFSYDSPRLDDLGISSSTGDYIARDLEKRYMNREHYSGVIKNWKAICPNTKTLVFTVGMEHAVSLTIAFNKIGVRAKYFVSKAFPETDKQYSNERYKLLQQFRDGAFDVLINCEVFTTGFDFPQLQTIVLDFATTSYTKYAQVTGRGSRPYSGKTDFYCLDFGGNIERHGIYEREDIPMSLWHSTGKLGIMPTKECDLSKKDKNGKRGCGRLIPVVSQVCPYCSYEYPSDKQIFEIELHEIIQEAREGLLTPKQWIASKLLEDWSLNRILCTMIIKNSGVSQYNTFIKVLELYKEITGKEIKPGYWYHFRREILDKHKVKK